MYIVLLSNLPFKANICVPNAAYVIVHADHYLSVCPDRLPRRYVGAEMVYTPVRSLNNMYYIGVLKY